MGTIAAAKSSTSGQSPARMPATLVRQARASWIKPMMYALIPAAWLRKLMHRRSRRWDAKFRSQPAVDVFTAIYAQGKWGTSPGGDFYSGSGSHDPQVILPYIKAVREFLQSLPCHPSVADLGCGDFNIGRQLRRFCGSYTACDVVPALISRNQAQFRDANVDFRCLDITRDELPHAGVALLRQVLQHLSNAQIMRVVPKLYRYRFLLLSEHLPAQPNFLPNLEKPTGALVRLFLHSGVILTAPPFNLKVKSVRAMGSVPQVIDGHAGFVRTTLYEL